METGGERQKCTGRAAGGTRPCGNWPIAGAKVCRKHGGAAPQVKAAAVRRVAEADVQRGLARLDVQPVGDPFEQLSALAGQVVAWKDALAAKVNELTTLRYEAMGAGTEQLRAEVALFE